MRSRVAESAGPTYGNLEGELLATILGLKSVENSWELLGIELDCV